MGGELKLDAAQLCGKAAIAGCMIYLSRKNFSEAIGFNYKN